MLRTTRPSTSRTSDAITARAGASFAAAATSTSLPLRLSSLPSAAHTAIVSARARATTARTAASATFFAYFRAWKNDETGDYWPKWRSALRCAMRPPAPARPPRAPASSMPTSAAYPSATQATNAHERSTAAHITARAHTDHCPAHSSGMF